MWIICSLYKPYDMQHFKNAAISLGVDLMIVNPNNLVILNDNQQITFYYDGQQIAAPSFALNWNGCMNGKLEEQIEASLIKCGTTICNSVTEINHWQDKFKWQVETKLPTVKSMKMHSSSLLKNIDIIEANFDYPLILKSDTGSLGMGVYKAIDRNNLKQLIEVISLLDTSFKVHIEKFINYQHDLRMYIIGDQYFLMERIAADDFRANVAQNATVQTFEKSRLIDQIFDTIRATYQAVVIGVDILLVGGDYYICEINSAPGFTGIESITDVDIAYQIIDTITSK